MDVAYLDHLGAFSLYRTTNQTLSNNTTTAISWQDVHYGRQRQAWTQWDSATPTKILRKYAGEEVHLYLVYGHVVFAANDDAGVRFVGSASKDSGDSQVSGDTWVQGALNDAGDGWAGSWATQLPKYIDESYLEIQVRQESGGDLDLDYARACFLRIW